MARWNLLGGTALAASLFAGTSAFADVTAEQVWQSWVDYYVSLGQTVTPESAAMEGDTYVVKNAVFASTMPDGGFSATVPEMRLKELGDGRVEVTLAPEIPIKVTGKTETGGASDVSLKMRQSGMTMVVSGVPEDMAYELSAPEIGVSVDSVMADGTAVPVVFDMAMKGNAGKYQMTNAGGTNVASDFTTDSITFNIDVTDPAGGAGFKSSGGFNNLAGTSKVTIPDGVNMAEMHKALAAGVVIDSSITSGGGAYSFDVQDPNAPMTGSVKGGGGSFNVAMSKDTFTYGVTGKAGEMSFSGAAMPMPVDVAYGETAVNFALPVSKGDTAQPFAALLKVVDLTVSEGVWGMIDPTAQLPRDPATMVVDVTGAAKMLVDIFDPANAASPAPPGELEALNLNALNVKVAGAELTGTGAATFDNSTGMPVPNGSVNLQLTGANALIDKLVAIGIIPEDQAMSTRMMLGMFAVASGDDSMTSEIVFNPDGSILANGQRIK